MKIALNIGISDGICSGSCAVCPIDSIPAPAHMRFGTFLKVMGRIARESDLLSMVNLSGYGEALEHPDFLQFTDLIKSNQQLCPDLPPFGLVTNGQGLTPFMLMCLDGVFDRIGISFGSINREHYEQLHKGLSYDVVLSHILDAVRILKKTKVTIHLTPSKVTDIRATVKHLRGLGVEDFVMFPFTFNRAGNAPTTVAQEFNENEYAKLSKELGIRRLEQVFRPTWWDLAKVLIKGNRMCLIKMSSLYIDSWGRYRYCINDVAWKHELGTVEKSHISEVLKRRCKSRSPICDGCNVAGVLTRRRVLKFLIR